MSEQKQERGDMTGVLVGITTDDLTGERSVAICLTNSQTNNTVILPNDVAVALFDSLGATLDALGLLDDEMGGVPCKH